MASINVPGSTGFSIVAAILIDMPLLRLKGNHSALASLGAAEALRQIMEAKHGHKSPWHEKITVWSEVER